MSTDPDVRPIEDQTARLEQSFIDEFLRRRGYDPAQLDGLPETERNELLTQAATYAASKLAEMESRAHYVREIRGER